MIEIECKIESERTCVRVKHREIYRELDRERESDIERECVCEREIYCPSHP